MKVQLEINLTDASLLMLIAPPEEVDIVTVLSTNLELYTSRSTFAEIAPPYCPPSLAVKLQSETTASFSTLIAPPRYVALEFSKVEFEILT